MPYTGSTSPRSLDNYLLIEKNKTFDKRFFAGEWAEIDSTLEYLIEGGLSF